VTWNGRTSKCILEFLEDNKKFMIIGEDEPDKLRPVAFEPAEEVVVFQKMAPEKKKK
jgi:hypothetical protein